MRRLREFLTDLVLVGPAALALLTFIFLPVAIVFVLAFTDYSVGAPSAEWVGFENFADLFGSRLGRNAILNTLQYVVIVIPASVGLGLLVALGLHGLAKQAPRIASALKAI